MSRAELTLALDLDGTLIDARPRQVGLAQFHLAQLGESLDSERFWHRKRDGLSTRAALESLGHSHAAEAATRWGRDIEDPRWLALDPWLPGARESLRALAARASLTVLTARRAPAALHAQLAQLGLPPLVHAILVVDPARAAEAKAAHLTGFDLFLGDTESDAEAAHRAGVPFIALASGVRSRAFLEARGLTVYEDLAAWAATPCPF